MSKKKKQRKKAVYKQRKQGRQSSAALDVVESPQEGIKPATIASEAKASKSKPVGADDMVGDRARKEVKHSLVLAAVILLGLFVMWLVFSKTGLGHAVYSLVKL